MRSRDQLRNRSAYLPLGNGRSHRRSEEGVSLLSAEELATSLRVSVRQVRRPLVHRLIHRLQYAPLPNPSDVAARIAHIRWVGVPPGTASPRLIASGLASFPGRRYNLRAGLSWVVGLLLTLQSNPLRESQIAKPRRPGLPLFS